MKLYLSIAFLLLFKAGVSQNTEVETLSVWTLKDCIKHAIENNISIKEVNLNIEQAGINYEEAKSSRLPNLFGNASQSFSNGTSIDPITSDYVTDQIYSTNIGLSSSLTLFQGNQISNQIKQKELLLNQSKLLEEEAKNNVTLSVLEMYLQVLYAKEEISIAEHNLNASEKEVERAKARLDAGSIALTDYTEAQSQAASNKYTLITAKNSYKQYIISLKQILELDPATEIALDTAIDDRAYMSADLNILDVYNNALNVLPEVNASRIEVEAQEKSLDIARGAYLPSLSLTGSLGSGYTSIDDMTFSSQFNYNFNQKVGLSLSVPIFNRNQTKAAAQTAQINIEKAKLNTVSTKKEIYQKIETAYQNARSAQEQMVAADASKTAAEQSYKLAQKKYELGGLSTTDLVISQNTYTIAQQNYLQAKYMSVLYHQLLQFYQGNDIKL